MGKGNVTTFQLDLLVTMINLVCRCGIKAETPDPVDPEVWRRERDSRVRRLHSVYKPSARPYAGRVVADIAIEVLLSDVLWLLGQVDKLDRQIRQVHQNSVDAREVAGLKKQLGRLRSENAALHREVERLEADLARRPRTVAVDIPAQQVVLRSDLQQEIVRLMGAEGLGRSWRIIERTAGAGLARENSVRNALRKLTGRGLIDDYRRHGRPVRWKVTTGGNRRLLRLTGTGEAWYREAFGREAAECEIAVMARRHRSIAHGVGILEARDHLRKAGHAVGDDPMAILLDSDDRWGSRTEPDLAVAMEGAVWPVEVQREVSERLLGKWSKALSLAGRLALVLFGEERRRRQEHILLRSLGALPAGEIRLASLEAMESGSWEWTALRSTHQ